MELTAIASWLNTACAGFDESVAIAVHRLYDIAGGFFTPVLSTVTLLAKEGLFLFLILLFFKKTRKYGMAILFAVICGALITNLAFKPLVLRPRPYTFEGSVYYEYWKMMGCHTESDFSFPSGHTTAAMAISMAVFLRGNRKVSWTAFFFMLVIALSRIYLSVHYMTDILGGILAGFIGGWAGYGISLLIPEKFYEMDFSFSRKGKHVK